MREEEGGVDDPGVAEVAAPEPVDGVSSAAEVEEEDEVNSRSGVEEAAACPILLEVSSVSMLSDIPLSSSSPALFGRGKWDVFPILPKRLSSVIFLPEEESEVFLCLYRFSLLPDPRIERS